MTPAERSTPGPEADSDVSCLGLRARIAAAGPDGSATGTAMGELVLDPREKEHIASCAVCRGALTQAAPAALFALLSLERKPDTFWTGFETRILAEIRESQRAPGGWAASLLRPRALALAAGVAMIASLAILGRVGGDEGRHGGWSVDAGRVVPSVSQRGLPVEVPSRSAAGGRSPGSELPLERNVAAPAPVETVYSPSARVYTINVEDPLRENDGSDVVVIVDSGIDI